MKNNTAKKIVIIYSLFILFVSFLPLKRIPQFEEFPVDKIFHYFLYLILVYFCMSAFTSAKYIKSFFYALFLGIFVEVVQYFLPYRSFDFKDIIVSTLGSITGLMWCKIFTPKNTLK